MIPLMEVRFGFVRCKGWRGWFGMTKYAETGLRRIVIDRNMVSAISDRTDGNISLLVAAATTIVVSGDFDYIVSLVERNRSL